MNRLEHKEPTQQCPAMLPVGVQVKPIQYPSGLWAPGVRFDLGGDVSTPFFFIHADDIEKFVRQLNEARSQSLVLNGKTN